MGQSHAPIVHRVLTKLARAEIAGVNAHTLPVALHRAERDGVPFDTLTERQAASAILDRAGYPETVDEMTTFLRTSQVLGAATLTVDEITDTRPIICVGSPRLSMIQMRMCSAMPAPCCAG
jgi:hypothetical protein